MASIPPPPSFLPSLRDHVRPATEESVHDRPTRTSCNGMGNGFFSHFSPIGMSKSVPCFKKLALLTSRARDYGMRTQVARSAWLWQQQGRVASAWLRRWMELVVVWLWRGAVVGRRSAWFEGMEWIDARARTYICRGI